ncbi:MAG: hypothetical protein K1W32_17350 [Schaedlerella sp.]
MLKKSWEEDYIGKAGTLAKNKLRNYQNIAIVLVALSARRHRRRRASGNSLFFK